MRRRLITAVSILAGGCITIAPAENAKAEEISICDLDARKDSLLNHTHDLRGYIKRDQHGLYASGLECPDEYVWVVLRDRGDADALKELMARTVEQLDEPTEEIVFRARIAMNDYKLPLTSSVYPRLSLEYISRASTEK